MPLKKIRMEDYDRLQRALAHHIERASLHIVLVAIAEATKDKSLDAARAVARAAGSRAVKAASEES